jgi:cell division protein FtsB
MIMLKKILPYIFLVIGAWVIYSLVFTRYELKTDVLNYERMIQELEAKVDSLHSKNGVLELQADSLEVKLNESDGRIKQLNSRIYVIKRETQKQLNAVDLFGDDQLEQFFARRYRESDSIN